MFLEIFRRRRNGEGSAEKRTAEGRSFNSTHPSAAPMVFGMSNIEEILDVISIPWMELQSMEIS